MSGTGLRFAIALLMVVSGGLASQAAAQGTKSARGTVTAIGGEFLQRAGAHAISDTALYAPNTYFSELTAGKVSNPSL